MMRMSFNIRFVNVLLETFHINFVVNHDRFSKAREGFDKRRTHRIAALKNSQNFEDYFFFYDCAVDGLQWPIHNPNFSSLAAQYVQAKENDNGIRILPSFFTLFTERTLVDERGPRLLDFSSLLTLVP
jgi:hypothetical protein